MSELIFFVRDKIPLSFNKTTNGIIQTGLAITVQVYNCVTGASLLSTTTCTEITPGIYTYLWAHGQTTWTDCMAIFTDVANAFNYSIYFTIADDDQSVSRVV